MTHLLTVSGRVALLVMGTPQFPTQDDLGIEHIDDGLAPIDEWRLLPVSTDLVQVLPLPATILAVDPAVVNVFIRVRALLQPRQHQTTLTDGKIHDLACFAIHRLLSARLGLQAVTTESTVTSESLRCGLAIYMFLLHGHSYYPHAEILYTLVVRLRHHLELWTESATPFLDDALKIWLLSVGLVAAAATPAWTWFARQATLAAGHYELQSWPDVLERLGKVLWHDSEYFESTFRTAWTHVLSAEGLTFSPG